MEVWGAVFSGLSWRFASLDQPPAAAVKNKYNTRLPISVCVSVAPKRVMVDEWGNDGQEAGHPVLIG